MRSAGDKESSIEGGCLHFPPTSLLPKPNLPPVFQLKNPSLLVLNSTLCPHAPVCRWNKLLLQLDSRLESQTGGVPSDCPAQGEERTACCKVITYNTESRSVAQRTASGPCKPKIPPTGVRPKVLARYRASVSASRERTARQHAVEGNIGLKRVALPGSRAQLQGVT